MTRPFVKSDPSPQDIFMGMKCNCGKSIRYSHNNNQASCNKYRVCISYDELDALLVKTSKELAQCKVALERIVRVNAMDYEYKAWAREVLDKLGD